MLYRSYRLPWRSSFPRSGSCCISNNPRGFLYLSAGIAVIGKIGPRHVRFLPLPKKRKDRRAWCLCPAAGELRSSREMLPSPCCCCAGGSWRPEKEPCRLRVWELARTARWLSPHGFPCSLPGALSHVMLSCPVSQAVWQWFAATWTAVTQQVAPPLHADLLLADDRRGPWQPVAGLDSLWQRDFACWSSWMPTAAPDHGQSSRRKPAHIAARVISAARIQMRRDWLRAGSDIRLRAGVLSHWLRGRQPTMTAEAFQSRWCHEEVLCSRPTEVTAPPHMHWTAAYPVPLPR